MMQLSAIPFFRCYGTLWGEEFWYFGGYHTRPIDCGDFMRLLRDYPHRWDMMKFTRIPGDAVSGLPAYASENGFRCFTRAVPSIRIISVDTSFEAYIARNCRREQILKLMRRHRRMQRKHSVIFKACTETLDVARALADAFLVSEKSWKADGGTHINAGNKMGQFYRKLFALLSDRGILLVHLLYADGKPVAFRINCLMDQICYCIKTGYDARYAEYSPGSILRYFAIRNIFDRTACRRIDFISDYPYLSSWTKQKIDCVNVLMFNRTPRGLLLEKLTYPYRKMRSWKPATYGSIPS
ncbi:MAG: GNAT family N-acetyltransferase [Acidobacteria bacterium]|nr:GNAT family N-acetyltransferase [Acidobacteriota bacterium]